MKTLVKLLHLIFLKTIKIMTTVVTQNVALLILVYS